MTVACITLSASHLTHCGNIDEMTSRKTKEVKTKTPGLKVFPSNTGLQYSVTYKGYLYVYHNTGSNKKIYRCSRHPKSSGECHARIHLSMDHKSIICEDLAGDESHNHGAEPAACDRKFGLWKMKCRAKCTTEGTTSIVAMELNEIPRSSHGSLPQMESMKRVIRLARATIGTKVNFASREEIPNLINEFLTSSGESFLKYDSGPSENRIFVFTTDKNLACLQDCNHWCVDGTFKSSPTLFDQLFVIHGMMVTNGQFHTVPLVYCLTPNRKTATYKKILEKIRELNPNLAPTSIMSDYEKASLKAFQAVFPGAMQRGCFFHFAQANFRHIQSDSDLFQKYNEDSEFSLQLRSLIALAFVPPTEVKACFEQVQSSDFFRNHEALLEGYLQYFASTWIGSFDWRGASKPPMFDVALWSCYDSVLQDLPKTNNACEGFHRGFAALLSAAHPTIFKLVEALLKQQNLTDCRLELILAGRPDLPKKKYLKLAAALKKKVEYYGTANVEQLKFLRGVAHSISV